jgi:membrane AbrB-like protein
MLRSFPKAAQWVALAGLSALLAGLFTLLELPAALLVGAMLAGIAITSLQGSIDLPNPLFLLAQGIVGCMISGILAKMLSVAPGNGHWGVIVAGALLVLAISTALGMLLNRLGLLPGTTALWGLSPGAASVMVVMSEAYGANSQIVALMQYLRLVLVIIIASITTRLLGADSHHPMNGTNWLAPVQWGSFAETLALAVIGPILATRLRIPAGGLLVPMVAGLALVELDWLKIELPPLFLAIAYAAIGWRIGLRFTPSILRQAVKALPQIVFCTLAMILACAAIAVFLVVAVGIDPLTAYLATSPGGADTAAILATSSHQIDAGFVMSMQTVRFVAVLALAPPLARILSRRHNAK